MLRQDFESRAGSEQGSLSLAPPEHVHSLYGLILSFLCQLLHSWQEQGPQVVVLVLLLINVLQHGSFQCVSGLCFQLLTIIAWRIQLLS